jgi:hypothetical protein
MDAAAARSMKKNIEAPKRDRVDREEVDREHAPCVLPQERPPRRARTLTGGTDARGVQETVFRPRVQSRIGSFW